MPPPDPRPLFLSVLRLRHFRNLGEQELTFPAEGVAIVGPNAQGKTNLLEAVYFLETFRSFRGSTTDQLVGFGQDGFWLGGQVESTNSGGDPLEISSGYRREGRKRKVTVDGVEVDRISDALGRLSAVVFSPSDVSIVSDGPDQRRRFLDIVLSLNREGYLDALQRYRHVLSQRNAALKSGQPGAVVTAWDRPLSEAGAFVMFERNNWVERWADAFRTYYLAVSGKRGASMAYRPCFKPEDWALDAVVAGFGDALAAAFENDRRRRTTTVGPHRDELELLIEDEGSGLELRRYGSGGQRRTGALALRLVEGATIREARQRAPIVLMDDVFAELDEDRSARVLELMSAEELGQVILTAPKESDVRVRPESLARWRIDAGRIVA